MKAFEQRYRILFLDPTQIFSADTKFTKPLTFGFGGVVCGAKQPEQYM